MEIQTEHWPARPWILAASLSIAGLAFYFTIEGISFSNDDLSHGRIALAVFILVSSLSFVFSLQQHRWRWSAIFAIAWGAILAAVSYWSINPNHTSFTWDFSFWSGLLAAAIAVPLFQTVRDQGKFALPYSKLHAHAWFDVVCWFATWLFVGISFGLAHLLAALFNLIGLEFLKNLLKESWFICLYMGASFGAALGTLQEQDKIIASLQNLVMTVLSILAPVLCISLSLFIISLPFTGLQPLWEATRGTTPILLSCAAGAIILGNAILRNNEKEESKNTLLRASSFGLSILLLPLAVIAFVSMQQRLNQYGLTPDRIWGLIAICTAIAYGLAYVASLVFAGSDWMAKVRRSNTMLAVMLCILTTILALPIMDFGAISIKNQLARLNDGRTKVEDFDFVAFAYDFGPKGRTALDELAVSDNPFLASGAKVVLHTESRWQARDNLSQMRSAELAIRQLVVYPESQVVPDALLDVINKQGGCVGEYCLLIWKEGESVARLLTSNCSHMATNLEGGYKKCPPTLIQLISKDDIWMPDGTGIYGEFDYINPIDSTKEEKETERLAIRDAIDKGDVEIRSVSRNQIFIGGKPVGRLFENKPNN